MKRGYPHFLACLVALNLLIPILGFSLSSAAEPPRNHWTIMHYGGVDNSAEQTIMSNYKQMKAGFVDDQGLALIVLADRSPAYSDDSTVFGEDFTDTRLYRITHDETERLDGGAEFPEITKTSNYEANTADAPTLKKFIRFCKANYPAEHYALIIYSHGGGMEMVFDEGNEGDWIYTAEMTDVLTAEESVDLIGLDVCSMGGVENAYQWRPGIDKFGAQALIASAPSSAPWNYKKILERLRSGGGDNGEENTMVGGKEKFYDPAFMTPRDLGGVIMEEICDMRMSYSWGYYDLTKVEAVKEKVDAFAVRLANQGEKDDLEFIRGSGRIVRTMNYMFPPPLVSEDAWFFPYFDLYDLAQRTAESRRFSKSIRSVAQEVMLAVDDLVVFSFEEHHGPGPVKFQNGRNGIYITFPDGDRVYSGSGMPFWAQFIYYNALSVTGETPEGWPEEEFGSYPAYGKYLWCDDGATPGNDTVENWFELLDSWFDTDNGPDGGLNKYQW